MKHVDKNKCRKIYSNFRVSFQNLSILEFNVSVLKTSASAREVCCSSSISSSSFSF